MVQLQLNYHHCNLGVIKDIAGGELLTMDNIAIIRPGLGLPPKYIDIVLGRVAKSDLSRGTALNWDHI
jgi:sialic acid synthase SpsE